MHLPALAILSLLLLNCNRNSASQDPIFLKEAWMGNVPSDGCLIQGEIITILDGLETGPDQPCAKVPCHAVVKIMEIEQIGSAVAERPYEGQELRMKFVFTLRETTEELFPNLDKRFPGLSEGEQFKAIMRAEMMIGKKNPQWVVQQYVVSSLTNKKMKK